MADATLVHRRRGTESQCESMIPGEAEIIVDLTNDTTRVGDGIRLGGFIQPNAFHIQQNKFSYAAVSGTADAILLATNPQILTLTSGTEVKFRAASNNTSTVTVDVGVGGAKDVNKITSLGVIPLQGGDIIAGGIYSLIYDGTAFIISGSVQSVPTISAGANQQHDDLSGVLPALGNRASAYLTDLSHTSYNQCVPYSVLIPYDGIVRTRLRAARNGAASTEDSPRLIWYKNGSAAGTTRTITNNFSVNSPPNFNMTAYTENISCSAGDILTLYGRKFDSSIRPDAFVREVFVSINEFLPAFPRF